MLRYVIGRPGPYPSGGKTWSPDELQTYLIPWKEGLSKLISSAYENADLVFLSLKETGDKRIWGPSETFMAGEILLEDIIEQAVNGLEPLKARSKPLGANRQRQVAIADRLAEMMRSHWPGPAGYANGHTFGTDDCLKKLTTF